MTRSWYSELGAKWLINARRKFQLKLIPNPYCRLSQNHSRIFGNRAAREIIKKKIYNNNFKSKFNGLIWVRSFVADIIQMYYQQDDMWIIKIIVFFLLFYDCRLFEQFQIDTASNQYGNYKNLKNKLKCLSGINSFFSISHIWHADNQIQLDKIRLNIYARSNN